ncbi:hypothetical protein Bca4012_010393 [Brassica carinata]
MVFHVTPFGPSCCEILYTHPNILKEEADADDALSFSFDYCFLAEVTASNLKEDKLYLSVEATTCTALNKQCQEIILVNKEGNSWTVSLRFSEQDGMFYIRRGWRKFCLDNRCAIGDLFVFNVVGDGKTTPLIRHLNTERGTSKECWCGQSAKLFTFGSVTNPGRLYYCCARGYHKRHLFKWVDECLVEEVEDIKPVIRGMNDDISFLLLNVARLGKEIEVIKTAHVRKRDECMRNVVVCGVGMAILCYYNFFV